MFEVCVMASFSSAHRLRGYKGKCEALHGHNWRVEILLSSRKLDKIGMVCDFTQIKERLNNILKEFDHNYLNDLTYFKKVNPTSENIAKYIFDKLKLFSRQQLALKKVTVFESENAYATYSKRGL